MNCMLVYDVSPGDVKDPTIVIDVLSAFSGVKWLKVFEGAYVLNLESHAAFEAVVKKLQAVGRKHKPFNFLISPPTPLGTFDGWLAEAVWKNINAITDPVIADE